MCTTLRSHPRIGFLSLSIEFYKKAIPEYIPFYEKFHFQLREILEKRTNVALDRLCYRHDEIEKAVSEMEF